jgi:hypothetical protein
MDLPLFLSRNERQSSSDLPVIDWEIVQEKKER